MDALVWAYLYLLVVGLMDGAIISDITTLGNEVS